MFKIQKRNAEPIEIAWPQRRDVVVYCEFTFKPTGVTHLGQIQGWKIVCIE